MDTGSSGPRAGAGSKLQRAIVLELLSDDGGKRLSRVALGEQLGVPAVELDTALSGLHAVGVVCLREQDVWVSTPIRRLDELRLIGI
jgi:DNA-binding GntR family transcriptional regulator